MNIVVEAQREAERKKNIETVPGVKAEVQWVELDLI